jgi:hypothetical protein
MKTSNRLFLINILFIASFFAGCASVPMTSIDEDVKAKSFSVPADKSNIYLYRNETIGGAIGMPVSLDGKLAGKTGPNTYFMWQVDPGSHEVSSITENTSTLIINTEAGKSYFIWQEVKMGFWQPRSKLQEVNEETGRKGVNECKRAQSNTP